MSQGAEGQADGGKAHQHSYSSLELDSSGSSGLPSILKAFTPERLTPVNNLDVGSDQTIPFLLDHPSAESLGIYEPRLMSVLTQTELSWLLSHRPKNTEVDKTAQESKAKLSSQQLTHSENSDQETESILGDDVSDTDSKGSLEAHIVHSEFVDDLKCGKLFGSSLHTLSSVGPPTILAYKQESKEKPINYEAMSPKDENILLQNLKELSEIREYWQWTSNRAIQTQLLLRNIEESSSPTNESAMSTGSGEEAPGHDAHLLQPIGVDNWKLFRDSVVSLGFDLCQFCGKSLKPLPTHKQLSTEPPETVT
uniref:uncharacterized protein isoform X2 n=1 Tax=Pristiophorus japonicus TaxID=55135 RepID=UPI00398F7853